MGVEIAGEVCGKAIWWVFIHLDEELEPATLDGVSKQRSEIGRESAYIDRLENQISPSCLERTNIKELIDHRKKAVGVSCYHVKPRFHLSRQFIRTRK